jgi:hypothetical protein
MLRVLAQIQFPVGSYLKSQNLTFRFVEEEPEEDLDMGDLFGY